MATTEPFNESLRVQTTYTISEAVEYMKERDKYITSETINWIDTKTGKPVIIGYN